jgi:RNA polymerase sigma-70 factor (ECF subfamily)
MVSRNDPKRFYQIVWPHMATVLRTAEFLTHSFADAEDLAQEAMIKAFKAIDTLRDENRVKSWLMAILRHARIDDARSEPKGEVSLNGLGFDPAERAAPSQPIHVFRCNAPEQILNSFEDRQIIEAIKQLPKEIRWTLLLVDVEGLDHCEVSQVLDVPVGTVKSRLHRGRAMLRADLEPLRRSLQMAM